MSGLSRQLMIWRVFQVVIWAAGMGVWLALIVRPELGLHLLWNVLIPVAPALFVVAPGVWRNVCPLGSLSLAPHHFRVSRRRKLSPDARARLYLAAFVLLIVVVPLRKVVLDSNGPLLAVVLGAVGVLAIAMGAVFDQKSGWCLSLCPVYPVELLYGSQSLISVPNAHCPVCSHCVAPCSESSAALTPVSALHTKLGQSVGSVLIGFFPGFVWGWYNVPTYRGWDGLSQLHVAYGLPYAAGVLTLLIYAGLRRFLPERAPLMDRIFAAAAIITYYWFRLPPVFGIGDPVAAMVVDISSHLPSWSATALRALVIVTFSYLLIVPAGRKRAWEVHPASAERPPAGVRNAGSA